MYSKIIPLFLTLVMSSSQVYADIDYADSPEFPLDLLTFPFDEPYDYSDSSPFGLDLYPVNRVSADSAAFFLDLTMPPGGNNEVSPEWVASYNGPGNGYDFANAVALDASGNVYVTGKSWGAGTNYDYSTIKYDPSGNQLWMARYNGPGNGHDSTSAIAVDPEGNVYVTGFCNIGPVDFDYATVKYDSSGNELWVARYDGPANMHDYAYAMDVDAWGNVYVTGRSCSSESNFDYATLKYDTNGNQLWVARYDPSGYAADEACAIAVDSEGDVYVTGHSWNLSSNLDYATVKYDSSGNEIWAARYNGQANAYDEPEAIALDSEGNIYVTGYSYGSSTCEDYATVKYDPSGNELWVARYDAANGSDRAEAVAVDTFGDVYVTGRSCGSGTGEDYATIKYDPSGNQLWVARYNGPANNQDYPEAMALDASDNIYVTGCSYGGSSIGYDYATVKYDPSGNELWAARYNGPGNGGDLSAAIALDTSGGLYLTGQSDRGTCDDYVTIKYYNTRVGPDEVVVFTEEGITVTFSNVTGQGCTTVTTSATGPSLPAGFCLAGTYYDITTTAVYDGDIHVCISYDDALVANEENLSLLHYEDGAWVDVTTSRDTAANIICGMVTSLSPFVLVEPIDATPPVITVTCPVPYGIYTAGMQLDFSASDAESGVAVVVGNLTNTAGESVAVSYGFTPDVGVYSLVVSATDNVGNTAQTDPVLFVVYDPGDGFATGGGWFLPDSESTLPGGKAEFGFVAKYKQGSSTGNLEFQYKAAEINLKSTTIDWLVISGVSAQFQGTATINGSGLYTFHVMAKDNGEPGVDADHFNIRIWEGTDTEADPIHKAKNTIAGGNIKVHKNKE